LLTDINYLTNLKFLVMKKSSRFAAAFFCTLFFTALIVQPVSAVTSKGSSNASAAIPENVLKIAQKSCVKCHTVPGNKMALSVLSLTKWDAYSAEKQASKAQAMCNMVTKGKMPPKKFRTSNPEGVPSNEEIATICNWAQSLQVVKK
jgi:hypothetical protein